MDQTLSVHLRVCTLNNSIYTYVVCLPFSDQTKILRPHPCLLLLLLLYFYFFSWAVSDDKWQSVWPVVLCCQISASDTSVSTLSFDHAGWDWNYSSKPGMKWDTGQSWEGEGDRGGAGRVDGWQRLGRAGKRAQTKKRGEKRKINQIRKRNM